jgi:RNA-binding protein
MARELTPAERQALKGRAHRLHPVVLVGGEGLTASVLAEIDRALTAHALIKVRILGEDRARRDALLAEICGATDAAPVQHIGKVLVIYREQAPDSAPAAPAARDARAPRRKRVAAKAGTFGRSARSRSRPAPARGAPSKAPRPPRPRRGKLRSR